MSFNFPETINRRLMKFGKSVADELEGKEKTLATLSSDLKTEQQRYLTLLKEFDDFKSRSFEGSKEQYEVEIARLTAENRTLQEREQQLIRDLESAVADREVCQTANNSLVEELNNTKATSSLLSEKLNKIRDRDVGLIEENKKLNALANREGNKLRYTRSVRNTYKSIDFEGLVDYHEVIDGKMTKMTVSRFTSIIEKQGISANDANYWKEHLLTAVTKKLENTTTHSDGGNDGEHVVQTVLLPSSEAGSTHIEYETGGRRSWATNEAFPVSKDVSMSAELYSPTTVTPSGYGSPGNSVTSNGNLFPGGSGVPYQPNTQNMYPITNSGVVGNGSSMSMYTAPDTVKNTQGTFPIISNGLSVPLSTRAISTKVSQLNQLFLSKIQSIDQTTQQSIVRYLHAFEQGSFDDTQYTELVKYLYSV